MRLAAMLLLTSLVLPLYAQTGTSGGTRLPDTLNIHVDDNGDPYFLHKTMVQTELSRIAFAFGCPVKDLQKANPQLTNSIVAAGDLLVIPIDTDLIVQKRSDSIEQVTVMYWVQPGETIFRIARVYFDMPVDLLMHINWLATPDIPAGRSLLVGWLNFDPDRTYAEVVLPEDTPLPQKASLDPFFSDEPLSSAGVAHWNKKNTDSGHLFAMHRTARINSLIEITNPMFHEKVLVKVVGRIPTTYANDVAVIVSPGVARALGAIDGRFRVEMRYVE